jgi:5-methylcytosine-specific restriction enzyme subunit McrC
LTTATVKASLDQHTVTESAFKYLCDLSAGFRSGGASLVQLEDRLSLRLDNFVGIVETPCGTVLEILPKHIGHADDAQWARGLLRKMLVSALDLPQRESGVANIDLFKSSLTEWVMHQFLRSLDHLVKRGVRFEYTRLEEEQRFLRGQMDIARQMRQPAGRQHVFQIRHDVFLPDRPENRLLRSALDKVLKTTEEPGNWRLARELVMLLSAIPPSSNPTTDFQLWHNERLMAHYRPVKPWCSLVLGEQMPLALKGSFHGMSLLFPMERLFERYVADCLRLRLTSVAKLDTQVGGKSLCTHDDKDFFGMRPDLKITQDGVSWILDTKWKRLDQTLRGFNKIEGKSSYGLSQSDFYQLFAYGHKYLNGKGDLVLIYPKTADFKKALPVFKFSNDLNLWVVPFDLDRRELLPFDCIPPFPLIADKTEIHEIITVALSAPAFSSKAQPADVEIPPSLLQAAVAPVYIYTEDDNLADKNDFQPCTRQGSCVA